MGRASRRHFGKDNDPILVWQADTRTMNPCVPQQVIDAATEQDPASAAAEWLAHFRSDVQALLTCEAVQACISFDVRERAPMQSEWYYAFADPSGGSADSMTIAIGHREKTYCASGSRRSRRSMWLFAGLLKSYHINKITSDRYAEEWPRERFREHGISYEPAQKSKSYLYRDLLPVINSRKIDLLDDARLLVQLVGLERRTARGGRDSIDHAPGRARRPGERGSWLSGRRQTRIVRQLLELGERL